jgi:hypothetical protein
LIHFPKEGSRWYISKYVALNVYQLAGWWLSLGIHISIVPPQLYLFLGWWSFAIMSASEGKDIRDNSEASYWELKEM